MRQSIMISLFMIVPILHCLAQDQIENSIPQNEENSQSRSNNFYLGAKVGVIFLLGVELDYVFKTKDISRFYMAVAVQSSVIINSANAGGGVFLGNSGLGLGCRYHHLLWFESEKESTIQPGVGPEVIYNKSIGTKYILNLHAGAIITEGYVFPEISFGVFMPLNK